MVGSASWTALKLVCMAPRLDTRIHPAGIENPDGVEGLLDRGRQRHEPGVERLKHVDAGPGRSFGADQSGMAAEFGKGAAELDGARVGDRWRFQPDQSARP